jgi:hypothetical protein
MIKKQYNSTDNDTFVTFIYSVGDTETFMVNVQNEKAFCLDITKRSIMETLPNTIENDNDQT